MNIAQTYPHGSAAFADERTVARTFRAKGGVPIGFLQRRLLFHEQSSGMTVIGGAGAGKFTSVLAHFMGTTSLSGRPIRILWFDPKGEAANVLGPGLIRQGTKVFTWDGYNLQQLSHHSLDLYAHLTVDSPTLVADSKRAAQTLLPENPSSENPFFEQAGQRWFDALIRGLVHLEGEVSYASLYRLLSLMRSHPESWQDKAEQMAACGSYDLGQTFAEMSSMMEQSQRTFDSVYAGMLNAISFIQDPNLQSNLLAKSEADFTLDVLCDLSNENIVVFFILPAELIQQNAALVRQLFSTMRILKQRAPHAPPVIMIIDEAGQLGRFKELEEFYSIGRGPGLVPVCFFQDRGQIAKNLGPTGAMTLSASSDVEMYLGGGVSDLQTAEYISRRLGNQTLILDDPLIQARAAKAKREAVHAMLFDGADPFQTGSTLAHLDVEMSHVKKQARALMSLDEVLGMPKDKALVFARGYGIRPFFVDKVPYYERREYAGRYFPNRYFDQSMDRLKVKTFWGKRWRSVIEENVPERFAHYPQYRDRMWKYIEGYRPNA